MKTLTQSPSKIVSAELRSSARSLVELTDLTGLSESVVQQTLDLLRARGQVVKSTSRAGTTIFWLK